MPRLPLLSAMLAVCTSLPAADVLLDAAWQTRDWSFHPGSEFPGAKGSFAGPAGDQPGLTLAWDFAGGGAYVAAEYRGPVPPATTAFTVTLHVDQDGAVAVRMRDAEGRTFQSAKIPLTRGQNRIEIPTAGPWESAWGGKDGAAPAAAAGLSILATSDASPQAGALVIESLGASSSLDATALAEPLAMADPVLDLAGWELQGTWVRQWHRPLLVGSIIAGAGAHDGELTISLAKPVRDWTRRIALRVADKTEPLRLSAPLGTNPNARYQLVVEVASAGRRASAEVELAGTASDPRLLGAPQATRDLPPSRFGSATHFNYGRKPGAFGGWAPYERLLDEMAACGLGWVRDGVSFEKTADGFAITAWDQAWLRATKARGLRTCIVLNMGADDAIEDLCARAKVLAAAKDLIDAIELGNEPNNFGGWVKKHGGKWNGMADDGGDAPWIKAHLAATNTIAEAIKAVRADVPVVGLGAVPPSNVRCLRLGLSPAVDGVVEHPYSMSLPPEVVPWNTAMEKRDGIGSGDAAGSLVGLMDWYFAQFAATGRERQLWITEFGWTGFRFDLKNTGGLFAGYDEDTQAVFLARRNLLHIWHGAAVSIQYDLLDDYGSDPKEGEANFGLLRADGSRKPAFLATQRMCSLFAGAERDRSTTATVLAAPVHRAQKPGVLVANWDGSDLSGAATPVVLPFARADQPDLRTLAVWSPLFTGGFTGRVCELRVEGWQGFGEPIAIGLLSGRITDIPVRADGDARVLTVALDGEPLAIRVFR
jgi:hypothetical protein